jgi:hypothetical protein
MTFKTLGSAQFTGRLQEEGGVEDNQGFDNWMPYMTLIMENVPSESYN